MAELIIQVAQEDIANFVPNETFMTYLSYHAFHLLEEFFGCLDAFH